MVLMSVRSGLGIWLCIFSLTVLLLWFHQSVDVGHVSCIRAIQHVDSLLPVSRATFSRGGRQPVGVFRRYGRLSNNWSWFRRVSAGDKLAAVLGDGDETVCTASLLDRQDGKALPGWRFSRLLSFVKGNHRLFQGRNVNGDINHVKLDHGPYELLRHKIAQVKYAQAGAWPHFFAAVAAEGLNWHLASPKWQTRARPFGLTVHYRDAGGGGDCMYLSVAAALAEVANQFPNLQGMDVRRLREAAGRGVVRHMSLLNGKTCERVTFVRKCESGERLLIYGTRQVLLCASTGGPATQEEKDEFMGILTVYAAMEDAEDWQDRWSPASILNKDEYVNSAGVKVQTDTPERKAQALYFEITRPGSTHWGSGQDLWGIERALNVHFIVLDESGVIYPLASRTELLRPLYILLYHRIGHFQRAGIKSDQTGIRSAFPANELPDFLHCIHIVDCHSPVYPTGGLPLQSAPV